ncbi:MAG: hypothetical protein IKB08_07435 [Clostridia bacterium]|nr:hypothetical protein [Oscillospiraceae bacterium]MBR2411542.1 hypothetical protein [Clostridia bacterium]
MDDIRREENPLFDNEAYARELKRAGKEKKKKNGSFVFGLVTVIFSLIGLFSCVFFALNFITAKTEEKKAEQLSQYNKFLIAVAAVDPSHFDDITASSMEELIEIAIWSIMRSDLPPDKYDYSSGELAIPLGDVENAFTKYFGTQVPIKHQTVTGYGYEFSYNAEYGCYYIPLTTIEPLYTPVVTSSEKKGDSVILTVGLINGSSWKQDTVSGEISRPDPDKYIKVTLHSSGQGSFISAIRTTSLPETAIVEVFTTAKAEETSSAEEDTAAGGVQ